MASCRKRTLTGRGGFVDVITMNIFTPLKSNACDNCLTVGMYRMFRTMSEQQMFLSDASLWSQTVSSEYTMQI